MSSPVLGTRDKNVESNPVPYPQEVNSLNIISNIIWQVRSHSIYERTGQRHLEQPGYYIQISEGYDW